MITYGLTKVRLTKNMNDQSLVNPGSDLDRFWLVHHNIRPVWVRRSGYHAPTSDINFGVVHAGRQEQGERIPSNRFKPPGTERPHLILLLKPSALPLRPCTIIGSVSQQSGTVCRMWVASLLPCATRTLCLQGHFGLSTELVRLVKD